MLTADHGEEFHEHGGFWHGLTLYDEQIHVPLLIKWPKGAPGAPPAARGHVSRHIDVLPTLLARAGIAAPAAMQGIDLATPASERAEKDRMSLAEEDHEGNVLRALRTREWKLIEANPGNPRGLAPEELFHVAADPGETRNLIGEQGEQARALRAQADAQQQLARSRAASGGGAAETLRRPAGSPAGARLRGVVCSVQGREPAGPGGGLLELRGHAQQASLATRVGHQLDADRQSVSRSGAAAARSPAGR